ncbi:MAG: NYN domain-containing protein, partial [Patescibacteria group bacterium]
KLTITDSSASQLTLSADAGVSQWAFRNAGGNLYFATTTVAGTATSSLAAFTIDGNGNVGVATTSPAAGFAVATHCVTADTRLRRRRKKKSASGKLEYEYDEVQIKDIEEGDEIQSLDERTGKLVWSRVNKLMYMGEKEIYKITTASGKTIRTTSEHPYLVQTKPEELPTKPKLGVFYDNSNMFYAQKKAGWKIDFGKLKQELSKSFDLQFINFYTAIPKEGDESREKTLKYISFVESLVSLRTKPLKYIDVLKVVDGKRMKVTEKKGDMDVDIALDVTEKIKDIDTLLIVSGDSDLLPLKNYSVNKGKKIVFASFENNMAWELIYSKFMLLDGYKESLAFKFEDGKKTTPKRELGVALLDLVYSQSPSLSSGGEWIKVKSLIEGQNIAVTKDQTAVWDKIVKIEKLPVEKVYDIEVEGTHNFVGNDIIAHNTYLGGNLTVQGSTRLDSSLTLNGAAPNSLLSTNASGIVTATSVPTFGAFNATSTNATSTIAGGLAIEGSGFVYDFSSGNVGIGTTGPSSKLHIVGVHPTL